MKKIICSLLFVSSLLGAMDDHPYEGKHEFDKRIWKTEAEFSIYWHDYKHAYTLITEYNQSIRPEFLETLKQHDEVFSRVGKPDQAIRAIIDYLK